jgi:hypothetical protein
MTIRTEREFKATLNALPVTAQRQVAARFVERVAGLSRDPRVTAAINAARRADISDAELEAAFHAARAAAVESYAQCGHAADWLCQAGHFVAEAAASCVLPAKRAGHLAWSAAMHARMARSFETIASGDGTQHDEAEQQYRILEETVKA